MSQKRRYPVAKAVRQMAALMNIDIARVLQRAHLSADFLDHESKGVTAKEYCALWQATFEEARKPELSLEMARAYAQGPYLPAILAFSSSPNTEIGLKRLALFKPLIAPVVLDTKRVDGALRIDILPAEPDVPMPDEMAACEAVYFLECMRRFAAEQIVPLAVHLPKGVGNREALEDFLGVAILPGSHMRMVISIEDAIRPLISENQALWETVEPGLQRQLAMREGPVPISERVQAVLVEILPSGDASVETVCKQLGMSKRSLQRHLQADNSSFQSVLDATRSQLAMGYLSKGEISVEEISYLLAYRDPNSFYRAFHSWTGMTPAEARGHSLQ